MVNCVPFLAKTWSGDANPRKLRMSIRINMATDWMQNWETRSSKASQFQKTKQFLRGKPKDSNLVRGVRSIAKYKIIGPIWYSSFLFYRCASDTNDLSNSSELPSLLIFTAFHFHILASKNRFHRTPHSLNRYQIFTLATDFVFLKFYQIHVYKKANQSSKEIY